MAVLADTGAPIVVAAEAPSRIAVIGGEAIEPRAMEWNFVSSRRERIEQAKNEWRQDRFAKVPGDEDDFVPLP